MYIFALLVNIIKVPKLIFYYNENTQVPLVINVFIFCKICNL